MAEKPFSWILALPPLFLLHEAEEYRTMLPWLSEHSSLVPAAVLVSRHGSSARKMGVPLVPFLAFGSVVALFFGDAILDAYLRLF